MTDARTIYAAWSALKLWRAGEAQIAEAAYWTVYFSNTVDINTQNNISSRFLFHNCFYSAQSEDWEHVVQCVDTLAGYRFMNKWSSFIEMIQKRFM